MRSRSYELVIRLVFVTDKTLDLHVQIVLLAKLCQLLDVSADYLIGISEDPDSKVVRIQSSMPSITARLNRELDPLADLTTIERQLVLDYARKLIAARPRPVEGPEKSEGAC